MTLKIGIMAGNADPAALDAVRDAERLGIDSVWAPEAWMYDALTPLAYLAAITERVRLATGVVQLGARSPAMLAMSALSMQKMSDGRKLRLSTRQYYGSKFEAAANRTTQDSLFVAKTQMVRFAKLTFATESLKVQPFDPNNKIFRLYELIERLN